MIRLALPRAERPEGSAASFSSPCTAARVPVNTRSVSPRLDLRLELVDWIESGCHVELAPHAPSSRAPWPGPSAHGSGRAGRRSTGSGEPIDHPSEVFRARRFLHHRWPNGFRSRRDQPFACTDRPMADARGAPHHDRVDAGTARQPWASAGASSKRAGASSSPVRDSPDAARRESIREQCSESGACFPRQHLEERPPTPLRTSRRRAQHTRPATPRCTPHEPLLHRGAAISRKRFSRIQYSKPAPRAVPKASRITTGERVGTRPSSADSEVLRLEAPSVLGHAETFPSAVSLPRPGRSYLARTADRALPRSPSPRRRLADAGVHAGQACDAITPLEARALRFDDRGRSPGRRSRRRSCPRFRAHMRQDAGLAALTNAAAHNGIGEDRQRSRSERAAWMQDHSGVARKSPMYYCVRQHASTLRYARCAPTQTWVAAGPGGGASLRSLRAHADVACGGPEEVRRSARCAPTQTWAGGGPGGGASLRSLRGRAPERRAWVNGRERSLLALRLFIDVVTEDGAKHRQRAHPMAGRKITSRAQRPPGAERITPPAG